MTQLRRIRRWGRLFAASIMSLLFVSTTMADTLKETGQDEIPAAKSTWQMCLELPNFSRLPTVYKEPIASKLVERMKEMGEENHKWFLSCPDFSKCRMSAEVVQRLETMKHIQALLDNCQIWHDLRQLVRGLLRLQTAPEAEHLQTYLEQRRIQGFGGHEELAQQAEVLRQKFEQSDPTKPYSQQIGTAEQQLLNDLTRKLTVLTEFGRWLEERR